MQHLALREQLPLDRHPALVYLARLNPTSRRVMGIALNRIAALLTNRRGRAVFIDWAAIRYQHAAAIRARLVDALSPASANQSLSALRGVLKEAWRLGQVTAEDYHRAVDIEPIRAVTLPKGRAVPAGEQSRLVRACLADKSPAGARDGAVVAVLYGGGLRRAAVAALRVKDYDPETGTITVRSGKGRKDRLVYVANRLKAILDKYTYRYGMDPEAPLFCPVTPGGKLLRRHLNPQSIYNLIKRRQREAGLEAMTPHDLRRSFVSDLLDAGVDVGTVQRLAGHSDVRTTLRYDRRGERTKREAVTALDVSV